jgi:hypothetical protein
MKLMKLPENPIQRRNVLGSIEETLSTGTKVDCLAIILCAYFQGHPDRPDEDPETDDNCHWGDWVIAQTNAWLDGLAGLLAPPPQCSESDLRELLQNATDANSALRDLCKSEGVVPDIHAEERIAFVTKLRERYFPGERFPLSKHVPLSDIGASASDVGGLEGEG